MKEPPTKTHRLRCQFPEASASRKPRVQDWVFDAALGSTRPASRSATLATDWQGMTLATDSHAMTLDGEQGIKPSRNRWGDVYERTHGDRRENYALQLSDYDINDWLVRKPRHIEATDQIARVIRQLAAVSKAPIAVSVTGSAGHSGQEKCRDILAHRRAHGVATRIRSLLSPALLRQVTFDDSAAGYIEAARETFACGSPELRSTLVSVHGIDRQPRPMPITPAGWCKYLVRCLAYDAEDLLSGTLGDVLDGGLGRLPPMHRQRVVEWQANLMKAVTRAMPQAGDWLGRALSELPVALVCERATLEVIERDKPAPGSIKLCYVGTGVRLDTSDLSCVDRVLPNVSIRVRQELKALLTNSGKRSGMPAQADAGSGIFRAFDVTRPILLREFVGPVSMVRDATKPGTVTVTFAAPAFRGHRAERVSIAPTTGSGKRVNAIPVQIGRVVRSEALSLTDGFFGSMGCVALSAAAMRSSWQARVRPGERTRLPLRLGTIAFPETANGNWDESEFDWSFDVDSLPEQHRVAYGHAQLAEMLLDDAELDALTFELLSLHDEVELEQFLGSLVRKVSRAASNVAKTAAKGLSTAAKGVAKAAVSVGKAALPIVGTVAKLASHMPLFPLARGVYGAVSALARGENPLMGALDGLAGTPLLRGLVKMGGAVLRGENVIKAAKMAVSAGIDDVREAARFAAMVAPFIPGIGTGVGAALGAANALASGRPITEALVAAVRGAVPGGALAQTAFDTAANLVKGQRIDQALLGAARNQLPPGPAQAAFDTGLAIAQGKKLQDAALTGLGSVLPPSPYAGDVLTFARRAMAGENLGRAALSTAGNAVLRRVEQQGGDLVRTVQGHAPPLVRKLQGHAPSPIKHLGRASTMKVPASAWQRRELAAYA